MNIEDISVPDLNMMHSNTVVMYKGEPVCILSVLEDRKFEIQSIKSQKITTVKYKEDQFDFSPIRIGFVNYRGYVTYIVRKPYRRYKQGTSTENISVEPPDVRTDTVREAQIRQACVNDMQRISNEALYNAIMRKYPSIPEILEMLKEEDTNYIIAFDPQFAITYRGFLIYRYNVVGKVDMKTGKIKFNEGLEYLRGVMHESI